MPEALQVVILGLSLSSSWGNGHATTYRGLVRELAKRGHRVTFLERDVPWYASSRDEPAPSYCSLRFYDGLEQLKDEYSEMVAAADVVVVGSYVPNGVEVGHWTCDIAKGITAFYDIDTPVTLSKLERGDYEYLSPELISRFDRYLSFTGGPTLRRIEDKYGSRGARPLYCSFDPDLYFPEEVEAKWDIGYLGTYSDDRQPGLDRMLIQAAERWSEGRFVVAGPQYPPAIRWPKGVERIEHLPPSRHREFYCGQRFTLNVTRVDMIRAGYSPSVRLFEAAGCGVPIISDYWDGLDSFFKIGEEIVVSRSPDDTLQYLWNMPETERRELGDKGRKRVLGSHTAAHRAEEFERYALEAREELAAAH